MTYFEFFSDAWPVSATDLPICDPIFTLFRLALLHGILRTLDEGLNVDCMLFRHSGGRTRLNSIPGKHRRLHRLLECICRTFNHWLVFRSCLGVRLQGEHQTSKGVHWHLLDSLRSGRNLDQSA